MNVVHFARSIPATPGRGARPVAVCAAIGGLRLTADPWRVTCERCLRTVGPEREQQAREDAAHPWAHTDDSRGDYGRDKAIDDALTGDA